MQSRSAPIQNKDHLRAFKFTDLLNRKEEGNTAILSYWNLKNNQWKLPIQQTYKNKPLRRPILINLLDRLLALASLIRCHLLKTRYNLAHILISLATVLLLSILDSFLKHLRHSWN